MKRRNLVLAGAVVMAGIAAGSFWLRDNELENVRIAAQKGEWAICLQRANALLALRRDHQEAMQWAARAALELQSWETAERWLDQISHPEPADLDKLGTGLASQKRLAKAARVFERILESSPENVAAMQKLAGIHFQAGELEKTRRIARVLTKHRDQAAMAYCLLGSIEGALGDAAAAVENFTSALALAPDGNGLPLPLIEVYTLLARDLLNLARAAEAERYLRLAVQSHASADVRQLLALARYEQDDLVDAEHWCLEALKRNPRHAAAFECLGMITDQKGQLAESIGWFKLAIRYTSIPAAGLHYKLSRIYARAGLAERAKQEAATANHLRDRNTLTELEDRVLTEQPDSPAAHFVLAQRAARKGSSREADDRLKVLFERFPNDPQVRKLQEELQQNAAETNRSRTRGPSPPRAMQSP